MVIIVISGCPGSGKTTLSRHLVEITDGILLSYDDILLELGEFSVDNFHQARVILLERLLANMQDFSTKNIFIDDVNHLKSLIKPYKRICQKYSSGFLHVIINIPLELALIQNLHRSAPVTEEVLRTHFFKLHQEKFWKKSKIIEFDTLENMSQEIINLIAEAEILTPKINLTEIQQQTIIHQIDLHLRKCIRTLITSVTPSERKKLAELGSLAKRNILSLVSRMPDPSLEYAQWQLESIFKL